MCRYHGSHIQCLTHRRPSAEAAAFEFGFPALPRVRGNTDQTRQPFVAQPSQFGQHRHQRSRRYRTDAFDLLRHLGFAVKMRVGVLVDLFVQFVNQPVKMGNQLFDAFDLRFVNLMQTVFLGSPHIHQLVAAVDQCFQHFFRFGGRVVEHAWFANLLSASSSVRRRRAFWHLWHRFVHNAGTNHIRNHFTLFVKGFVQFFLKILNNFIAVLLELRHNHPPSRAKVCAHAQFHCYP